MIPTKKLLGYGGSASVAGTQLLITSGSFDVSTAVSYLEMISTPPATTKAGRVQFAEGTRGYTGTLSFDVHETGLDLFKTTGGLLERYFKFDVGINDGVTDYKMTDCKLTSLVISGSVGGLINAQISFLSKSSKESGSTPHVFIRDTAIPLGYWWSGTADGDNVKDWSLSMTQDAELMYKNVANTPGSPEDPGYIKIGLVSYVLSVTSYKLLTPGTTQAISIATKTFTLTGNATGSGYGFVGITDLGEYSYVFETGSDTGKSDGLVIS